MGKYASTDDFTHRLTAFTWACLATSTLALTGRCTARYLKRADVGLDDVFAAAAYVGLPTVLGRNSFSLTCLGLSTYIRHLGSHDDAYGGVQSCAYDGDEVRAGSQCKQSRYPMNFTTD